MNTTKKNKNTKLIFWNCRSIRCHLPELQAIVKKNDIIICVETWLNNLSDINFNINFPGYITLREDRSHSNGGGILILIKKNIAFYKLDLNTIQSQEVEILGVKITNTKVPFNIIAVYRPPGKNLTQNKWDKIFDSNKYQGNTIILGDFNAHHTSWNCLHNDTNGNRLLNTIQTRDLIVHNINSFSHINTRNGSLSNLDLIISNSSISDKIKFKIDKDTHGSDHFPIHITIDLDKYIYQKNSFKLTSVRTNYIGLEESLNKLYFKFFLSDYTELNS